MQVPPLPSKLDYIESLPISAPVVKLSEPTPHEKKTNAYSSGKLRVKLIVDLTRYDSRCVIGSLGSTGYGEAYSMWARGSDRFTGVRFDNGARLDILWDSLEVLV